MNEEERGDGDEESVDPEELDAAIGEMLEDMVVQFQQEIDLNSTSDLTHLENVLNSSAMRRMIHDMSQELEENPFVLDLNVFVNGTLKVFEDIRVSRVPLPPHHHRKFKPNPRRTGADAPECGICISRFRRNETVTKLNCDHQFHKTCLDTWLDQKGQCPLCRDHINLFRCESHVGVVHL